MSRAKTFGITALLAGVCLLGAGLQAAANGNADPLRGPLTKNTIVSDQESVLTAQYYRDNRDRVNDRRWRDDDDDDGNRNRRLRRGRRDRDDDDD